MPSDAKTAGSVLRHRPGEAAAVIGAARPGRTATVRAGVGGTSLVVGDVAAAAVAGADRRGIGVAPQGGELPAAWRACVLEAVRGAGLAAFRRDHAPAA